MSEPFGDLESIGITREMWNEMQESLRVALSNVRDPEVMRLAAEQMDELSAQIRNRIGIVDLAVPLVRECRDEV